MAPRTQRGERADGAARGRVHSPEGDAILVARTRLGLTQPAFAARLAQVLGRPVDRTQVAKWEAGVYRPRAAVTLAAAGLIGLPLHELLQEARAMRGPEPDPPASSPRRRRGPDAPATEDLTDPRQQLRALLALGFTLPEALHLVRTSEASAGTDVTRGDP